MLVLPAIFYVLVADLDGEADARSRASPLPGVADVNVLIIGFLRETEAGMAVKDLCRRHGFSEASYYLWRSKFGGMSVPEAM